MLPVTTGEPSSVWDPVARRHEVCSSNARTRMEEIGFMAKVRKVYRDTHSPSRSCPECLDSFNFVLKLDQDYLVTEEREVGAAQWEESLRD